MMILNTETLSIEAGQSLYRVPVDIFERATRKKIGHFQVFPDVHGVCELTVEGDLDHALQTELMLGLGQYLFEAEPITSFKVHGLKADLPLLNGSEFFEPGHIQAHADQQESIEVAIVAVLNKNNEILLGKRPTGNFMPGVWEHPGGKLDPGETPQVAASRELQEEIAIDIKDYEDLYIMDYAFSNRTLKGYVSLVTAWDGDPWPRVHEELKWVKMDDLKTTSMPLSNLIHLSKTIDLIQQKGLSS